MTGSNRAWTPRGMKILERKPSFPSHVTTLENGSPISFQNPHPAKTLLLALSLLCRVARSL